MIRLRTTLLPAMCIICTWSPLNAEQVEQGVLASGTPFESHWYSRDSELDGPTVLVIGGMHGNEPAGHRAARQIATWPVSVGKLVVVPAANPPALAARTRRIPGLEDDAGDLNRHFPIVDGVVVPTGPVGPELWEFVLSVEPDILIDLHEGYGFRAAGSKSVGSSVITHRREDDQTQSMLLEAVNVDIDDPERKFVPLRTIVARSLARAAAETLDAEAHIFETTTGKQSLSLRCRQHRTLVATRLLELGMLEESDGAIDQLVDAGDQRPKVAIYDGDGAGSGSQGRLFERQLPGCRVDRIGPRDVRAGCLDQFDVVVFPGGSGSGQGKAIGERGREAVRSFVDGGGAYIGVCAGAYLAL
ncbi:MAG: succinylglutamate desuccinylase/aspartoacylase family protein, partial [Phycisphaerales bacterium]|nr:succinylglutamate desuccinylase/aspartoacylase family protein [Phycisphaerales bacterium]